MPLHLISATPLAEQLASHAVSARQQTAYLSASFILWLLPSYLYISPPPNFNAWSIPLGVWLYELLALVMIYVFGIRYCLAKCRVEPRRNFLVDFSCLYAPISLSTLVAVWSIFYVYAWVIPWWLQQLTFETRPYAIEFFYSPRFADLLRFFAVVLSVFIVVVRIGRHMGRISDIRLSANSSFNERDVGAGGADARRPT